MVSIHAPVKGATGVVRRLAFGGPVSIHAPVKGATAATANDVRLIIVSIHAPVKGATWITMLAIKDENGFNPRAREGRDTKNLRSRVFLTFQSTRP